MLLKKLPIFLMITSIVLAACTSNSDKQTYAASDVNRMQSTQTSAGTVKTVEVVNIDGKSSWIGSTSGSVVGGVLGSTIGSGWGRVATSIIGSIAGGFAGQGTEKQLTKSQGLKLGIERDDGFFFTTIIKPKEQDQYFKVGDRVKIVASSQGTVHLSHE